MRFRLVYALVLAIVVLGTATPRGALSAAASAGGSAGRIEQDAGYPVFTLGGRPFFVYGAAFFYERIPRERWESDMRALRALGVNTLDLYVIWNWHELDDANFDFDGHTNPRRDLRTVLRLAKDLGFAVIVRPGPVIRNEWRNAGYPAWLLRRPEYGMPLHDLLEGRYPPTATLQNAHSDQAAEQWLGNATHLSYARRWLEHALQVVVDSGVDIVGVALDDDQGAYIDNQTWPAPHLTTYLNWLQSITRRFTSAPAFINTYEMKVTASAPVWAMGNWYQSDAYEIGDHDRSQLAFSAGLLQTQERGPLMLSEFQAGWLQQPGDALPRAADPSNTLLAAHTLLGMGLHGLVNFPAQDTMYPAGWEVPFANEFYAWDAALALNAATQPRAVPTRRFGGMVATFGRMLAATHVAADAAIGYTTSAFAQGSVNAAELDTIVAATMQAQQACRDASLTCKLVDLRYVQASQLRRYALLFVPQPSAALAFPHMVARARQEVAMYRHSGGVVVTYSGGLQRRTIDAALKQAQHRRFVEGASGATELASNVGPGEFLVAANYDRTRSMDDRNVSVALNGGGRFNLPHLRVRPRDAVFIPLDVSLRPLSKVFRPEDRIVVSTCGFDGADALAGGISLHVDDATLPCRTLLRIAGHAISLKLSGPQSDIQIASAGAAFCERRSADPTIVDVLPSPGPRSMLPVRSDLRLAAALPAPTERPTATLLDAYNDGFPVAVLQNGLVRVIASPYAGGRAFVFEDLATGTNAFTTVGALRDDVTDPPTPSPNDYIAKYTHQFPAGTFNRHYGVSPHMSAEAASVQLEYVAPDLAPGGVRFEKTVTLARDLRVVAVDERVTFIGHVASGQRGISLSSLSVGNLRDPTTQVTLTPEPHHFRAGAAFQVGSGHALGFYDQTTHELAALAWRATDVDRAELEDRPDSVVARLTLVPTRLTHVLYDYERIPTLPEASARLQQLDAQAQGR